MVALNVFAAETSEEAKRLATSQHQSFLNLIRGHPGKIQPPVEDMDAVWSPEEKAMVKSRLGGSIIGDREKVAAKLQRFADETEADEIMVNAIMFDHEARKRSYEIVAEIWKAERANSAMG